MSSSSTEHIEAVVDQHVLCEGFSRQPLTKKRSAEPLRHNLTAVQHDLPDAVKVVKEYHHKLIKHFNHLYHNNFESELMVEHCVKKNLELLTCNTATR